MAEEAEEAAEAAEAAEAGEAAEAEEAAEAAQPESAGEAIEVEYPEEAAEAAEATEAEEAKTPIVAGRHGPGALTKLLEQVPNLPKGVRSRLYQMARRSQDLAQYQELAPSLSRLRETAAAAESMAQMDQAFRADDPQQFWSALYEAGKDGGIYARNVQFLHKTFLDHLAGNADLKEAVDKLRGALGWNGAAAQPGTPELPLHIRQQLDELQTLRTRRSEEAARQTETFLDETASQVAGELREFVAGLLANTRLSDYDKRNIGRDFIEAVAEAADQDKVQQAALDELLKSGGATPATRSKMVARAKAWARQNGRDILEPILQRAGAGLKQRQESSSAAKARHEPSGAGAPAAPATPNARDLIKAAETKAGRRLSDREILELV